MTAANDNRPAPRCLPILGVVRGDGRVTLRDPGGLLASRARLIPFPRPRGEA